MSSCALSSWRLHRACLLRISGNASVARRRGRRALQAIVPRDAKLEGPLYTRSAPIKGGLTEGPAAAPDGSIYFSDIPNGPDKGMIVRYDPQTNKSEIFTNDSGKANGMFFDAKGNPHRLRRLRRRGPPRLEMEREDERADHAGRSLHGQTLQRAQRPHHRPPGADLLHRPALPGDRAARIGAPGRLPHRRRWQGRGSHPRHLQAERHRSQPR